jgi:ankyrin repeat protein
VGLLLQQGANRIIEDDEGWTALHWAIVGGHTGAVKLLLTEVGNDMESDKSGHDKALILVAEKGNDAMARMLLAEGASVNYKDDQGSTPLDWSVPMGHETTTRLLLDHGADPNSTDHYGNISLHWSIANRVIAHMLVTCGAEIDKRNNQGQSALVWSTLADQVDVVKTLTDLGADVNAKDGFGCTALHAAALRGNDTIVQILLKHKADPNIRDKDGWTPLHAAVANGHRNVSDILAGLTVNSEGILSQVTGWIANEDMTALAAEMADRKSTGSSVVSGLRSAVNSGYQLRLLALLEQGDDINAIDKIGGCTALTHAAWMGQEDTVQLLLDHGAAIDARDRSGRSALHWASEGGYPDMVTILVDRGANVDMKLFGWTPLLLGARRWNASVVERLIGSGASLSARDFHGRSVLHWCCKHGDKYMTEVVLRAGTDVDARDHYDQTAIHYATASGKPAIVRLLLKYGADPSQQARDGSTALHMAAYTGQLDVAAVLFNDKKRKQRRQAGTATAIVPTALDREGFTAQAIAELTNNLQFMGILRREETESPGPETCDAAPVYHLPVNHHGLREALLAKPPLRLPHDEECDYTIHGEGMDSLGLPIFSKEVWKWLHKQSEFQQKT